jgi:hypothetical protein
MPESYAKKSLFSKVMLVTYVVDAGLIAVEQAFGAAKWHETMMLGLMVLMFGKFIEISMTLVKLERENSPWKEEQEFVEARPEFGHWARSVVASYAQAETYANATFQEHLKDELEEFRVRIAGYGRGYIENAHDRSPAFFYRHPDFFARDTSQRMLATCVVERGTFWESGSSLPMLERQGQLTRQGVDVMRIFIEHKERLVALRHAIQLHQQHGVPVLIAVVNDDKNPLPERLQNDFMVVDHDVLIRQEMRNGKLSATKVWLDGNPDGRREIDKAIRDFEFLRREYALPPAEAFRRAGIAVSAGGAEVR